MQIAGTITQSELYEQLKAAQACDMRYLKSNGEITELNGWVWARVYKQAHQAARTQSRRKQADDRLRWRTSLLTIHQPGTDQYRDIYPARILMFNGLKVID